MKKQQKPDYSIKEVLVEIKNLQDFTSFLQGYVYATGARARSIKKAIRAASRGNEHKKLIGLHDQLSYNNGKHDAASELLTVLGKEPDIHPVS
jgi:hypothetical protein